VQLQTGFAHFFTSDICLSCTASLGNVMHNSGLSFPAEETSRGNDSLSKQDQFMCGRYARCSDKQKIAELFAVKGPVIPDLGPSWNIAPQTFQPVVRLRCDAGEREIVMMRWGLIPSPYGPRSRGSASARSMRRQRPSLQRRHFVERSSIAAVSSLPTRSTNGRNWMRRQCSRSLSD
jgi:hypothetical protein